MYGRFSPALRCTRLSSKHGAFFEPHVGCNLTAYSFSGTVLEEVDADEDEDDLKDTPAAADLEEMETEEDDDEEDEDEEDKDEDENGLF